MKKIFTSVILVLLLNGLHGQQSILDDYIRIGLESNLSLKQKSAEIEKSLWALKEARSLFLPNVSLKSRYTIASGGRTIDFPVGDLLNPVYSTLNLLTMSNNFPQIDNQSFNFYRPTEQETKLELAQAVYNAQIRLNYQLNKHLLNAEKANLETYSDELVCDIKTAYYNYLKTVRHLEILDEARSLVQENIRVNEKLFEQGKLTIDAVYRAKSELSQLEQEFAYAKTENSSARSYFNFLLNRDLNAEILQTESTILPNPFTNPEAAAASALEKRNELQQLQHYTSASATSVKINRSNNYPGIYIVADYGLQGESFEFNKDADFLLVSAVLNWDIFNGRGNHARVQQAMINELQLQDKLAETKKLIELQVTRNWYELEAAGQAIQAAEDQVLAASQVFRIKSRQYEEGQCTLIEFMDARNNLTMAKTKQNLAIYNYMVKLAELEKVCGIIKY